MDWQALGLTISPIVALIGYIHMRITGVEKIVAKTVSESEVKEILGFRLENVYAWQSLNDKRLDRIEKALDALASKIDQLLTKN